MKAALRCARNRLYQVLFLERIFSEEYTRIRPFAAGLVLLAMALRLFFWVYTGRLWEDSLITTLHSENFWRGLGLTHYFPGQPPLHGFTSPISVLIPLIGDAVHIGWGVEFLKLVSVFAGALTVLYMGALASHPKVKLPPPLVVLLMGYVAIEHHQILWGMAGMETQVVTLILIMTFYYLADWLPTAVGFCLGLCMLARPDFAFLTIVAGLYVLAKSPRAFVKVTLIALAVYLPWIIFTTLYYGSPVPNTVLAKGAGYRIWWMYPALTFTDVKREVWDRITGTYFFNTIFQPLGPSFAGHGTHFRQIINDHGWVCNGMVLTLCLGALAALWRRQWALLPVMGFVFVYGVFYVFFVGFVFGWYVVPFVAAAIILSARGWEAITTLIPHTKLRTTLLWAGVTAYLAIFALLLPITFHTERQIQKYIENQCRMQIGLYLGEVMGPEETVGCEPLGYVGYYSRRAVYDWPGLCNRKVVEWQRSQVERRTMYDMFQHFQPDYLVLRLHEYRYIPEDKKDWFDQNYREMKRFSVPMQDRIKIRLFHVNQDLDFLVFKRIPQNARS